MFLVLAISIISALAGVVLYRSTLYQPELISAAVAPETGLTTAPESVPHVSFDDIVLKDLDGKERHLSDWKNPILVVNFWAPWCAPCRREIPALVDLQNNDKDDMQIIGLSFDNAQNVTNFLQKTPMNYPLLLVRDESTQVNQFFGNSSRAIPFTAILNQQREIVFSHSGEITRQQLETQINALRR
jgi:thiol-disulfide isomerase/thioredoxin